MKKQNKIDLFQEVFRSPKYPHSTVAIFFSELWKEQQKFILKKAQNEFL